MGYEEYSAVHAALIRKWPVRPDAVDVPTKWGTTRVWVTGPESGSPLILLSDHGASGAVWLENIETLSRDRRVYAVEIAPADGLGPGTQGQFLDWMDLLLGQLGLDTVGLCGHGMGALIAVKYAAHAPERVTELALLDPIQCFAGIRFGYALRATVVGVFRSESRQRKFFDWEIGGVPVDEDWLRLMALEATIPGRKAVYFTRPTDRQLRKLRMPVLVLLAGRGRAHNADRVGRLAAASLRNGVVEILPDATHHSMPLWPAARINVVLAGFLR